MPKNIRNKPPITDNVFIIGYIFSIYVTAFSVTTAASRKGNIRPAEYIANNNAPSSAVAENAASNNIETKIGPAHGVQPSPNMEPNAKAVTGLPA